MRPSSGFVALVVIFAVYGQSSAFEKTNKLLSSLKQLHDDATTSSQCYNDMEAPRVRVGEFVTDTVGIYDGLTVLNARAGTINTLISAVALFPGATVLVPITTGLTYLNRAISLTQTGVEPIINAMRQWKAPIQNTGQISSGNIKLLSSVKTSANNGKQHVQLVAGEIAQVVCGGKRSGLLGNMESAASGMDAVPKAASTEIQRAQVLCVEVKTFFTDTGGKIDTSVTTVLSLAKDGINAVNSVFDPIQKYIDEVDKVLDTKLCLADVIRIATEAGLADVLESITDAEKPAYEKPAAGKPSKPSKPSYSKYGGKRRAVEIGVRYKLKRQKRDVCVTVRQILDGTIAVAGGYTAVADFLIREVFKKVVPAFPDITKKLEDMASTLLPFKIDFDLQTKSNAMTLNPAPINNFLAIDYVQTFWERPASSDLSGSSQTCPSETALVVV